MLNRKLSLNKIKNSIVNLWCTNKLLFEVQHHILFNLILEISYYVAYEA